MCFQKENFCRWHWKDPWQHGRRPWLFTGALCFVSLVTLNSTNSGEHVPMFCDYGDKYTENPWNFNLRHSNLHRPSCSVCYKRPLELSASGQKITLSKCPTCQVVSYCQDHNQDTEVLFLGNMMDIVFLSFYCPFFPDWAHLFCTFEGLCIDAFCMNNAPVCQHSPHLMRIRTTKSFLRSGWVINFSTHSICTYTISICPHSPIKFILYMWCGLSADSAC